MTSCWNKRRKYVEYILFSYSSRVFFCYLKKKFEGGSLNLETPRSSGYTALCIPYVCVEINHSVIFSHRFDWKTRRVIIIVPSLGEIIEKSYGVWRIIRAACDTNFRFVIRFLSREPVYTHKYVYMARVRRSRRRFSYVHCDIVHRPPFTGLSRPGIPCSPFPFSNRTIITPALRFPWLSRRAAISCACIYRPGGGTMYAL